MKTLKKVNNLILLLIAISLSVTSCKDDDEAIFTPTLPPITQTGANTFGCYINGKLLVPRDGEGTFNSPSPGMMYWGSSMNNYNEIEVWDYKVGKSLILHIRNLRQNGEGVYDIENGNCQSYPNQTINLLCKLKDENTQMINIYCSIENTGVLDIIRYDLPNRIVSGTFSCKAVNRDNPNDIIEITDGRFDINWVTLDNTIFI